MPITTEITPFNGAPFFSGIEPQGELVPLSDEVFRRLILAKCAANLSGVDAFSINEVLKLIVGDTPKAYVRDNLDMTATLVFEGALPPTTRAIITQSGIIPRPAGVSLNAEEQTSGGSITYEI